MHVPIGLSRLGEPELIAMCREMENKFKNLSELLVVGLQLRDKFVTELTVKNKFISATLRVKSLKHSITASGHAMEGSGRPRSKSRITEDRVNGRVS